MVYLHTAVMNRIRDQARRAKRRGSQVDVQDAPLDSGAPSPYEQCVAEETRTRYRRALLALSEEERCAVILKLELDYKPTDLARALNKDTPDAARVYTKRAIMKLAREMGRG